MTNAAECPWNAMFMLFKLDLSKVPVRDTKWMAETAIIARIHALLEGRVLSVTPRKIRGGELEGLDERLDTSYRDLNVFIVDDDIGFLMLRAH